LHLHRKTCDKYKKNRAALQALRRQLELEATLSPTDATAKRQKTSHSPQYAQEGMQFIGPSLVEGD
jgi:hypothetical protein